MRKKAVPFTKKEIEQIISKYINEGYSSARLGLEFSRLPQTINKILKKNGIDIRPRRKYTLNQHYFDVIDTEEKAYFLGLLYADGSISSNKNYTITISLQLSDKAVLDKFNKEIDSNRPIYFKKPFAKSNKNLTCNGLYILNIHSKHMCSALTRLGCHPNKTFTLKFPTSEQVPEHLLRHFIRGLWDGDGCFSYGVSNNKKKKSKENYFCANFVGTEDMCENIKYFLNKRLKVNFYIKKPKDCRLTTRLLQTGGKRQVGRLLLWLYQDCKVFIDRKYNKLLEIMKSIYKNININSLDDINGKEFEKIEYKTITDEELSKLLWEKPIKYITKELNIHKNTLLKWINLSGLSRPPLGYWRKKNKSEFVPT
jgi:hypothetical protein